MFAAVVVPVVIFGVPFVVGGGDFLSACACALVLVIFSLDAWGKACLGIWEIGAAGSSANKCCRALLALLVECSGEACCWC